MTELERAFRHYNRKYFDNQLPVPPDVKLCFEDMGKDPVLGYTDYDEEKIALDAKTRRYDRLWRGTLLHEMVHLLLPPGAGHGKKFQAEMLRLAQAGAFKDLW